MTKYTFNPTVPNAPNNPSVDQPVMLNNTVSEFGIWTQDHVGYNMLNGGTHLQTTFAQYATPSLVGTAPSVAFPAAGVDDPAHAQFYFQNPQATYPLSAVKAFGSFVSTMPGIAPTFLNQYNVNLSMVSKTGNIYSIPLIANVVSSSNVIAIVTTSSIVATFSYTFTSPTLSITGPSFYTGNYNFLILQI